MIRKIKLLVICGIIFTGIFTKNMVKAASFIDDGTVDSNKIWTIKFTSEVGFDDLTKQGITVTNSKGVRENIGINLGQDSKTVTVTAPSEGYTPGENYTLVIGTNTHSKKGNTLKKEYRLHFNIKSSYVVTFSKDLEKVVREQINKPTGNIYKSDVENIVALDASKKSITDISGIENLTNLKILDLSQNQISDISGLKYLNDLSYLRLDDNQIRDISILKTFTNLRTLWLNNNQISDISSLKGLTYLQELCLKSNRISNISGLEGLSNLKILYLAKNQILDYSPTKGYYNNLVSKDFDLLDVIDNSDIVKFKDKNLEQAVRFEIKKLVGDIYKSDVEKIVSLQAYSKGIIDISGIERLTSLQSLDLSENEISDISTLRDLTKLRTLLLSNNQISYINALQDLGNLQELSLDNNRISDISGLQYLTNLQELHLNNNRISDVSKLEWLTSLKILYLAQNHISDYTPLKRYYDNLTDKDFTMSGSNTPEDTVTFKDENLEKAIRDKIKKQSGEIYKTDVINIISLNASGKGIKDISGIENLVNLQILDLSHNQIKDISLLSDLNDLKTLNLSYNETRDISKLRGLDNLETLNLNSNEISDIGAVQALNNLKALNLSNNQISNINPLKGLTDLQTLWLNKNEISNSDKEALKDILSNCNIYYDIPY